MTGVATAGGLDPSCEFPHEPAAVERWTENLQWSVVGADGLGVIWHAGTMLTDPTMWHVVVVVTLPDGTVLAGKIVALGAAGVFGPDVAHLATVKPFEQWRLKFVAGMRTVSDAERVSGLVTDEANTPVRIELDLRAGHPLWVPEGSDAHLEWGQFHHEQAVLASGVITVEGREYRLDGVGHRDHSTGPRNMTNLHRAFWGNGTFESGWSFATMWGDYGSDEFQRAAIFDSNGCQDARMVEWSRIEDATGAPLDFVVDLDAAGKSVPITARCRGGMNFTVLDGAEFGLGTDVGSPDRYLLTCMFVDLTCNGERGMGYIDRGALIRLLGVRSDGDG